MLTFGFLLRWGLFPRRAKHKWHKTCFWFISIIYFFFSAAARRDRIHCTAPAHIRYFQKILRQRDTRARAFGFFVVFCVMVAAASKQTNKQRQLFKCATIRRFDGSESNRTEIPLPDGKRGTPGIRKKCILCLGETCFYSPRCDPLRLDSIPGRKRKSRSTAEGNNIQAARTTKN